MGDGSYFVYMENERRRDRIWKTILVTVYSKGEVKISDIDVSLTQKVNTEAEAEYLIGKADHRDEDCITEDVDGGYIVELEPDASDTTKRSVLTTMTKDRFGLLRKDEDQTGVWVAGPLLNVLFDVESNETEEERIEAISEDVFKGSNTLEGMQNALTRLTEAQ